ncbi:hypothetical protein [Altererythrobacter sp. MF3-039]|uniref:hypothetical protein n=1 Tax=Altererythrobacter sp. MF3-039 TaxID=3252901 RepID=UPI00390C5522
MEPLGLPTKEAFAAIPCGKTKGFELIARGELETYKVDGALRVSTDSIRKYVARRLAERQQAA